MRMYDKIYSMKFLPPGRGLWAMGTPIIEQKQIYPALNNCAFVSTKGDGPRDFIRSCAFLMDSSMVGIGTGFDTKGKGLYKVFKPNKEDRKTIVIDDSREGWVDSLVSLLQSYLLN